MHVPPVKVAAVAVASSPAGDSSPKAISTGNASVKIFGYRIRRSAALNASDDDVARSLQSVILQAVPSLFKQTVVLLEVAPLADRVADENDGHFCERNRLNGIANISISRFPGLQASPHTSLSVVIQIITCDGSLIFSRESRNIDQDGDGVAAVYGDAVRDLFGAKNDKIDLDRWSGQLSHLP